MGATRADIADVLSKGYEGWLDAQLAMPRSLTLWDALVARGESNPANSNGQGGYDPAVWASLITAPDQLRQRVGTALLDFIVVGLTSLIANWQQFNAAAHLDILMDNAFGNYRTLLEKISFSPAMGVYLSFQNNKKADPATGAMPDENYAREIMQLFSIGLHQLNMDGTVKMANGLPLESYTQNDVSQLARVFTGLILADGYFVSHETCRKPMKIEPAWNETGSSTFLGKTVSGGGVAAIQAALDHIFAHPNVPPFVSKQLIQRLVTSNPSPAYVQRISTVFADNGSGVRGDLKAVVRAILLDTEARGDAALTSTTAGRLRSPVQRFTGWARAFNVSSPSNAWAIGNTSNPATGLGQSTGQSPSVFNFFRPGYSPPGTAMSTLGLVAPEFQIANEQSVFGYVNFMYRAVSEGTGDVKADYGAILAKAGDPQALIDEVNLLLAASQLSSTTVAKIKAAVESTSSTASRVGIAILLTLASPEFLVTR